MSNVSSLISSIVESFVAHLIDKEIHDFAFPNETK